MSSDFHSLAQPHETIAPPIGDRAAIAEALEGADGLAGGVVTEAAVAIAARFQEERALADAIAEASRALLKELNRNAACGLITTAALVGMNRLEQLLNRREAQPASVVG